MHGNFTTNVIFYFCRITLYDDFAISPNALTPSPNWPSVESGVDISTTPPLSEAQPGAVDFSLWAEIGREFLYKSNINNWLSCVPNGGSLVDLYPGQVKCNITKIIVPSVCEDVVPYMLNVFQLSTTKTPSLHASGFYYFFDTLISDYYPAADPCGLTQSNHLSGISVPSGWLYLRMIDPIIPNVTVIYNSTNTGGKYLKAFKRSRK